ncbi:MAG: hypothetical protein JXR30_03745 [Alphaproteobacteria bacterium]|nr:hypothetical protein [Alphaproteobacteria bacterium]
MIRFLFLFAFFPLSVLAQIDCAFQQKDPVHVVMKINYGTPQYNQAPSSFITQKTKNEHVRGYTEAFLGMSYSGKIFAQNGCVFPHTITVFYGYPKLDVFIDDKYAKDSCEYNEILAHENQHVFVHQDTLKQYSTRFGEVIKKIAQTLYPISFSHPDEFDAITKKMIQQIQSHPEVLSLQREFERAVQEGNNALDRTDNYQEIKSRCENW